MVKVSSSSFFFSQACRKSIVTQQHSQVTQHLMGLAIPVCLKDQPGKHSLIGESSATSSFSGPSKFATFVTDLCKAFLQKHHFLK
jgi:hypothetical protein